MSLRGSCPIVAVRDVAESTRFYTETLGFQQVIDNAEHGFSLVRRGAAMIGLVHGADEQALRATAMNVSAQIWIENVDALWSELKDRLEQLPEGRVRAPFTQSYGTREFHVKCPDGFLMLFTQDDSLED